MKIAKKKPRLSARPEKKRSQSPADKTCYVLSLQESISGIGGAIAASRHKPDLSCFSAFAAQPGYKIALSHHPEYWPLLKDENIDLILSGHAHGGQIRMYTPIKREWIGTGAPGQGWWPRWTWGVYESRLVVSAGLSNTTWVPRLFNPTEVVYIEP